MMTTTSSSSSRHATTAISRTRQGRCERIVALGDDAFGARSGRGDMSHRLGKAWDDGSILSRIPMLVFLQNLAGHRRGLALDADSLVNIVVRDGGLLKDGNHVRFHPTLHAETLSLGNGGTLRLCQGCTVLGKVGNHVAVAKAIGETCA